MKILGVDTTTGFLSLGVYVNSKIYEYNIEVGRLLSSLLAPNIKRVLAALNLQASDIDYFACGLGPGSFTGMRVGLATMKGLSWAANKPVIGIPTLDILARGLNYQDCLIAPIVDAKRNLIYCSLYECRDCVVKRIKPYLLLGWNDFAKMVRKINSGKSKARQIKFLGDAAALYKEKILGEIRGAKIQDRDCWYPKGHVIMELALERIAQKKYSGSAEVKPIYLYPKECQIIKI